MIDAINNLFLETYESYTGKARPSGAAESKRIIIHFHTAADCDACLENSHQDLTDL